MQPTQGYTLTGPVGNGLVESDAAQNPTSGEMLQQLSTLLHDAQILRILFVPRQVRLIEDVSAERLRLC